MNKKTLNKIRVKMLKAMTWLAGILWCLSVCCLDSNTNVPIMAVIISTAWLTLIYAANCPESVKRRL